MDLLKNRIDSFSQKVEDASTPGAIRNLLRLRTQIRDDLKKAARQSGKFDRANEQLMQKMRETRFVSI